MISNTIKKTLSNIYLFLNNTFPNDISDIHNELNRIIEHNVSDICINNTQEEFSYETIQKTLSNINEKEYIRKSKGVYYTPTDVVDFITQNTISLYNDKKNFEYNTKNIPLEFCLEKTVFDPTCGAGEFLLSYIKYKHKILKENNMDNIENLIKIFGTIYGNDINKESIIITKLRLFLYYINYVSIRNIADIITILNNNFSNSDFLSFNSVKKFDIITGNPPYIEDSKVDVKLTNKYGNIYANVLEQSSLLLNENGVLSFIIPISYISTPRMKKIRTLLEETTPEQYIFNFSDRPDCLFISVHQKLSIIFTKKSPNKKLYTSNYIYWKKEERPNLFKNLHFVENNFEEPNFIPKLGSSIDCSIYNKILKQKKELNDFLNKENVPIYINMRTTYWMKVFLQKHNGGEYKEFKCANENESKYAMCLLNSSLFWWFWVLVSDCWHVTKKELAFKFPEITDYKKIIELANNLENKLESTKEYVGTKQTEYEYKHKKCLKEIHEIDDYINSLFGLTQEESDYIKHFAIKYRIGG